MHRPHYATAAIVGLVAGLAGAYTMELWQTGALDLKKTAAKASGEKVEESIPATEKAADAISRVVSGKPVPEDRRTAAGRAVHYATGGIIGVIYAVTCEVWTDASLAFGGGLALMSSGLLDNLAVPALGFGPPPQETSPGDHLYGVGAHVIFGVITEGVRRLLRGSEAGEIR